MFLSFASFGSWCCERKAAKRTKNTPSTTHTDKHGRTACSNPDGLSGMKRKRRARARHCWIQESFLLFWNGLAPRMNFELKQEAAAAALGADAWRSAIKSYPKAEPGTGRVGLAGFTNCMAPPFGTRRGVKQPRVSLSASELHSRPFRVAERRRMRRFYQLD